MKASKRLTLWTKWFYGRSSDKDNEQSELLEEFRLMLEIIDQIKKGEDDAEVVKKEMLHYKAKCVDLMCIIDDFQKKPK